MKLKMIEREKIKMKKMYCPFCDKEHEVKILANETITKIKGEEVKFIEQNYYCEICDVEFSDGEMFDNNLLRARDQYRKQHNLLTSNEIKSIREKYGLSQSTLALILGWGEVTITRYETKEIQNENYDAILRKISNDPYYLYDCFKLNINNFTQKQQMKISQKIFSIAPNNDQTNKLIEESLIKKHFGLDQEITGRREIYLQRIFAVIRQIINSGIELYKTKLAKLLWFIDINHYKKTRQSITGLAYLHMTHGACPLGLDLILDSKNISINEIEEDDYTKYLIETVESDYILSSEELDSINEVINKFKNLKTKEIVDYMHNERAYLETKNNEFISFSYAKYVQI